MTAQKDDNLKIEMDLLDSRFLEGVSRVLTLGRLKYSAENWRDGLTTRRTIAACLRHIFAWLRGEENDPQSGENHLLHAGCELMFTYWTVFARPELDNRWTPTGGKSGAPVELENFPGQTLQITVSKSKRKAR